MKPVRTRIAIIVPVLLAVVSYGAEAVAQAVSIPWQGPVGTGAPYDVGANWEGLLVPDGTYGEFATISNGGISVINSQVTDSPLEIRVGENAGSTGGLVIQDGGGITVATNVDGNGQIQNGVNGVGTVTLHDAMGDVNVEGYVQNGTSTLNLEIGGTTFNPVTVSNQITLNGILQVNGVLPGSVGVGSSWPVFDGSAGKAAVTGQFNQIINNTNYTFVEGQSFVMATGNNSATLEIQQLLVLHVDPYAGTAVLSNPTGSGVNLDMTAYAMTVNDGTVDGNLWNKLADNGFSGFVEVARDTQVGGTAATSVATVTPGTNVDFGSPLVINTNRPIGTDVMEGAVSFQYTTPDHEIIDALIVREGDRQNNLVLVVDPVDGSALLQNQSNEDVDLSGYVVESSSGALLATWDDLEGQGVPGWDVVAGTSNALAELNPENLSMLGVGDTLDLGVLWDLSERDLSLQFAMAANSTLDGAVFYGDPLDIGGEGITGDYNNNVKVEQADLDLVLLNWGKEVPPIPAGWTNDLPTEPKIDQDDLDRVLLNWGNTAAVSAATTVPEPASLGMVIAMGLAGCLILRSRRGTDTSGC